MLEAFLLRLENKIREEGYSIRTFESYCGLSNGTISRAIRINKSFQVDVILKICQKFPHWDLNELFLGDQIDNEKNDEGQNISPASSAEGLIEEVVKLGIKARLLQDKTSTRST